jgi:hypothetical protein
LQYLRNFSNFNTLMGIVAGLNLSAIQRLKHTLALVDMSEFKQLELLMDPTGSFKAYRQAFQDAKAPCLPYMYEVAHLLGDDRETDCERERETVPLTNTLPRSASGVYLTDMIFIEDGNPDTIDNCINFEKRKMVCSVLDVCMHNDCITRGVPSIWLCLFASFADTGAGGHND